MKAANKAAAFDSPASPDNRRHWSESKSIRRLRRGLSATALRLAARAAPWFPAALINLGELCIDQFGRRMPILARNIKANMQAAGVYSDEVFRRHFQLLAGHLANGVRLFRMHNSPQEIRALARQHIELDTSVKIVHDAVNGHSGAVLCAGHVCSYLISLTRLREEFPVCVYLRWSRDEKRVQIKKNWCEAAGIDVIVEPENMSDPTSRAMACVEALRSGKLLVITPDIAQKKSKGSPVKILNQNAYIHSGPASLAMLAEVPMIPLFGRDLGGKHSQYFDVPILVQSKSRAEGGRQAALNEAMQLWANAMSGFLRSSPQSWFMWGDSRWTRVFRGDPEYTDLAPRGGLAQEGDR